MKNLVLSAMLVAGLSQVAGCIIVADDTSTGEGDLTVTWSLLSSNTSDPANPTIPGGCPVGADTMKVYAVRANDTPYTSKLLCANGTGPFNRLPEGTYTVWVEITDHDGTIKFAQSAEQTVTVTADAITPVNFSLYSDRAFFAASWNLTRTGSPTTCAAVNAGKMSILATVSGGSNGFDDDSLQCTAGEGANIAITTTPVPVGQSYTVVVAALNSVGESIGDSSPLINRALDIGNTALDLQTVTVPIR